MDKLREDIFKILFPSADTARADDLEMIDRIIARVRQGDKQPYISNGTTDTPVNTPWWSHTG